MSPALINRRDWLKQAAALSAASLAGCSRKQQMAVPRRPLGRTGASLSVIGFGGVITLGMTQADVDYLIHRTVDRGINYFDTAPSYGRGEAETKMGHALRDRRDKIFLACKTKGRTGKEARADLEQSLRRLHTDHFDLYQMHSIKDPVQDVERARQDDGALPALLQAQQEGLIRHLGFSSHTVEAALYAIETGLFDSMMHPVNFVCHYRSSFDQRPLAAAAEKNMGVIALKAMARAQKPPDYWDTFKGGKEWYERIDDPVTAGLAMRWSLSRGVTTVLPPGTARHFEMAINSLSNTQPLTDAETAVLKRIARDNKPLFV